jgi:hypothetical protein
MHKYTIQCLDSGLPFLHHDFSEIFRVAMFLRMAALLAVTLGSDSSEKDIKNYAALENPFRMQKINLGVYLKKAVL